MRKTFLPFPSCAAFRSDCAEALSPQLRKQRAALFCARAKIPLSIPPAAKPGEGPRARATPPLRLPQSSAHSPRRAHPRNIGCGPRFRFPLRLPSEDARQGQPSPAVSLGLPRKEAAEAKSRRIRFAPPEKDATPAYAAREAERRPFPAQNHTPAQNRALSSRQVPPARASPGGTQQRCRNDILPMFATMSASTAKTGSPRQAAARPLSFAGQVPDRIKLSAQSIFLKDHFFII